MKTKWVTVQFMKLDIFFEDFNTTVSYNNDTSRVSILHAYDSKTGITIDVSAEMFQEIEEAVKNIISNIN